MFLSLELELEKSRVFYLYYPRQSNSKLFLIYFIKDTSQFLTEQVLFTKVLIINIVTMYLIARV